MSYFSIIVLAIGSLILLLGITCAIAICYRAIKPSDKTIGEGFMVSLWSMFILGTSSGLLLVWAALP
jgi:hypothetical protein